MKILSNPVKEAANRSAHGLGFELVEDFFRLPVLVVPDDRPLGHEHEGRLRALGQVYGRVFFLAYQPEDLAAGSADLVPIRDTNREPDLLELLSMSGAKPSFPDLPPIPSDEEIARQVRQNPDAVAIMSEAEIRAALAREDALDRYGVVRLRRKLGLVQAQFAERFGIPVGTLRNWEQGLREPDAASRVLLEVIARFPDVVADTVRRRRSPEQAA